MLVVKNKLDTEYNLTLPLYYFDLWKNLLPNVFENTLKNVNNTNKQKQVKFEVGLLFRITVYHSVIFSNFPNNDKWKKIN